MIVVVEACDGRLLDGPVHSLPLTIGARVVDLGQPMLDPMLVTDAIEDVVERLFVVGVVGNLDAVVGEYRVDGTGHSVDQIAQELRCDHLARFFVEFGRGEL